MRAGKRLPPPLRHGERPRRACCDAKTLSRRGKVSVTLPPTIALDLVTCVKATALEKAFGETERHRGVVAPAPARQIEWTASEQITHRGKRSEAAILSRSSQRITDAQSEECAEKPAAHSARRRQRRFVEQRIGRDFVGGSG